MTQRFMINFTSECDRMSIPLKIDFAILQLNVDDFWRWRLILMGQGLLISKTPSIMILRCSLVVCWGGIAWVTIKFQWFMMLETIFWPGQGPLLMTTPPVIILKVSIVVSWVVIAWVNKIIWELIIYPILVCSVQWIMMIFRKDKIAVAPWVLSLIKYKRSKLSKMTSSNLLKLKNIINKVMISWKIQGRIHNELTSTRN